VYISYSFNGNAGTASFCGFKQPLQRGAKQIKSRGFFSVGVKRAVALAGAGFGSNQSAAKVAGKA
jgi:hypothetical protein